MLIKSCRIKLLIKKSKLTRHEVDSTNKTALNIRQPIYSFMYKKQFLMKQMMLRMIHDCLIKDWGFFVYQGKKNSYGKSSEDYG